jgi:hypothetical protein
VVQEYANELARRRDRINVSNTRNGSEPTDLAVGPGHASEIGEAGKIRREKKLRHPILASIFSLANISTAVDEPSGQFVKEPDIVRSRICDRRILK